MERTAIVTGASRGIGQATALALAAEGFDIAAVAWRDTERLAALGGLLDAVARACGAVHCLVNNAGLSVLRRGDLLDVAADSYDRCFDVNTRGTFFLTQAGGRRMGAAPET